MCGGVHYGEVEGLVSVERWPCSRGASCVVEYTMGRPVGARRCLEVCGGIGGLGGHSTHNCTDWGASGSHFKPNLSTSKVSLASTLFISFPLLKGQ